jgi:hypothetical protein
MYISLLLIHLTRKSVYSTVLGYIGRYLSFNNDQGEVELHICQLISPHLRSPYYIAQQTISAVVSVVPNP